MNRSPLYKTAVILFAMMSLFSILAAVPSLLGGPDTESITQGVPQALILGGALAGVAGLFATYGAWKGQKWGIWLAIILSATSGLSALPGVLFAPNNTARLLAIVSVALSIFVIVVLLRQPRLATN